MKIAPFYRYFLPLLLIFYPIKGEVPLSFQLTFITFNLENYGADKKLISLKNSYLRQLIKEEGPSLLALQEIKSPNHIRRLLRSQKEEDGLHLINNYQVIFSNSGGSGEQHLALLYNKNIFIVGHTKELHLNYRKKSDNLRPVLWVQLYNKRDHQLWHVMVVHLKAGGWYQARKKREKQFHYLTQQITLLKSKGIITDNTPLLILGDFNTTDIMRLGKEHAFNHFLKKENMASVEKKIKCSNYFRDRPSLLDHIVLSKNIIEKVNSYKLQVLGLCRELRCKVKTNGSASLIDRVSDHCPVKLGMNF